MHVLIPFDVKPTSQRSVEAALDFVGEQDDVHITAVHFSRGEDLPAELAAQEIESMAAEHPVSVDADIREVEHGAESKPAIREAITDIIENDDIDLVVLGYEEKSAFEEVFRRDTAERVLETHEIPVLLVP